MVTAGGLNSAQLRFMHGVLVGEVETAARDNAFPIVPAPLLSAWANEQAALISEMKVPDEERLIANAVVLMCGGYSLELPVGVMEEEYFSRQRLREMLGHISELRVYWKEEVEYDEDEDSCHPKDFRDDFEAVPIFFVSDFVPNVYSATNRNWPQCLWSPSDRKTLTLESAVRAEIEKAWHGQVKEELSAERVGYVGAVEISRRVSIFSAT
jgi:hypothetical protein